jgi:DNA-binding transcriptional LysR family regulator
MQGIQTFSSPSRNFTETTGFQAHNHSSLCTQMAGRNSWCSPNSWAGVGAVFPNVEVRHLHAVIALGEELHFTKAALRLNLTQSALSRQITEIEKQLRFRLFTRDNRRVVRVELTDAGQVFVAEARSSLLHMERAFHLARTAHDGADNVLTIGHSHEADQAWVSDLLAVRLPLYPNLAIRLISQFSIELVRSVLAGELNLALVTAPPEGLSDRGFTIRSDAALCGSSRRPRLR